MKDIQKTYYKTSVRKQFQIPRWIIALKFYCCCLWLSISMSVLWLLSVCLVGRSVGVGRWVLVSVSFGRCRWRSVGVCRCRSVGVGRSVCVGWLVCVGRSGSVGRCRSVSVGRDTISPCQSVCGCRCVSVGVGVGRLLSVGAVGRCWSVGVGRWVSVGGCRQCFKLSQKCCRPSCLESQIINIKLKKNQQKVPGPPLKLSASDWRTCGNFQHWVSVGQCWFVGWCRSAGVGRPVSLLVSVGWCRCRWVGVRVGRGRWVGVG